MWRAYDTYVTSVGEVELAIKSQTMIFSKTQPNRNHEHLAKSQSM